MSLWRDYPADRHVLVVDDDAGMRETMAGYLAQHGLRVDTARDAATMERILARAPVDVVVLDVLMPPGEDGLSVCRRMSAAGGPPVILMSEAAADIDRIVGLELGADDYVAKPCNPRELLARVRAVSRRGWSPEPRETGFTVTFAGWRLDMVRRDLRDPAGCPVDLSSGEYAVLRALIERPQRVLSREQLIEYAWGEGANPTDRAIDTQICRLRKKLSRGSGPELIRTLRNQGYMLAAKVSREI